MQIINNQDQIIHVAFATMILAEFTAIKPFKSVQSPLKHILTKILKMFTHSMEIEVALYLNTQIQLLAMRSPSLESSALLTQKLHQPIRRTQHHVYKLKSYLPEIKNSFRSNNLLSITKQAFNKNQMLYLDLYEDSGIRILEHSPEPEHEEDDENQTFGKVKVVELKNLSQRCKKTLSYFTASQAQKSKRDSVRKSIFDKLRTMDYNAKSRQHNSENRDRSESYKQSLIKQKHVSVFERNRKLPKKQKYLIQKLGIVTGNHMFRAQEKPIYSARLSIPDYEKNEEFQTLRPILSLRRQPKQEINKGRSKNKRSKLQSSMFSEQNSTVLTEGI